MSMRQVNGALIQYEVAGAGLLFVMIHAGVADSRQWNNEFPYFARRFRVLRYDLRGHGQSEPVEGEFSHLQDLTALLDQVGFDSPLILMGCSMGGGLAMDFALTHPSRVMALIMVGSGPSGLRLDVPAPPKFEEAEKAEREGDLDRLAEIETQIWFDGTGRAPDQVNAAMRRLAYEMNRKVISHDAKKLGKRLPDTRVPAAARLGELHVPTLIIVGACDTPYLLAAADHMAEKISSAHKVVLADAAHLPNMDHPEEFRHALTTFLDRVAPR